MKGLSLLVLCGLGLLSCSKPAPAFFLSRFASEMVALSALR